MWLKQYYHSAFYRCVCTHAFAIQYFAIPYSLAEHGCLDERGVGEQQQQISASNVISH